MFRAEQMMDMSAFAASLLGTTIVRRREAPLAQPTVSSQHLGAFGSPLAGGPVSPRQLARADRPWYERVAQLGWVHVVIQPATTVG